MRGMPNRSLAIMLLGILCLAVAASSAQQIAPPTPQRLNIHSKVLNENRAVWVRTPPGYEQSKERYPVLYLTDAPDNVNEIGTVIDFLADNRRMPELIVVGIGNTDRRRDLTPHESEVKNPDGTVTRYTGGAADKFLDFIERELMPEIEKRYRTAPYRIFVGHSLGGLLAIHTFSTRPDLFNAYIAISPSLHSDTGRTLHEAQQFLAARSELKKTLFLSLANEDAVPNPMGDYFEQLRRTLASGAPKGFIWDSERYPDEDHLSTVLRAHYAGLRTVFSGWQVGLDEKTGLLGGSLSAVEQHYRDISDRFGYSILIPENVLNILGYQLMALKKNTEATAVFERYVELYPGSPNAYDSLGEALEAAGNFEAAARNFKKAIELGTSNSDESLPEFKKHLARVTAEAKSPATTK